MTPTQRKMDKVPRGFWFIIISLVVSQGSFACQGVHYTRQDDHQLQGHVIETLALDEASCLWQCKLTPNCFSTNLYRGLQHRWYCELNSSSKKSHTGDLIARDGSTYLEIQRLYDCTYNQGISTYSGIYYKEALPDGWYHFNASFFKAFWEKRIWWKARKTCRNLHGDLASIRSEHENKFIREVFRIPQWNQQHNDSCETWKTEEGNRCVFPFVYQGRLHEFCISNTSVPLSQSWCSITGNFDKDRKWGFCKENPVQKLWLGLKYNNESENFTWVGGSSTSYENWGARGRGPCVVMRRGGTWKNMKCAHKLFFVCEKK